MIERIEFKFGQASKAENLNIDLTPITVFVGPNNSGKSITLFELWQLCNNGIKTENNKIIKNIEFKRIRRIEEIINSISLKPTTHEKVGSGEVIVKWQGSRLPIAISYLHTIFSDISQHSSDYCRYYLKHKTLMLNGSNRIALTGQQTAGDLQAEPINSLQKLFLNPKVREDIRRILFEAFGLYLVVDPTFLGNLRLRFSSRMPADEEEEQGISSRSRQFHSGAQLIDDMSDGVKAFTGMLIEILTGDPSVILIDEPEAFLHPSLINKFALEIAKQTQKSEKNILVSTHSPHFVMGCVQSGSPINIVRLTYRQGVPTARLLPSDELLNLMRNPLMRSTGVLNALFYEHVIITESDADRAFYQEINERLQRVGEGIPNCLFINAQNKQTIRTIIKPLRNLGIPVAGIVDIDVLKDGGKNWSNLLESVYIPEIERRPFGEIRSAINCKLEATGKNMKRDGGISLLDGSDKEAAENLFSKLSEYGLFVVDVGELESWLKHLEVTGHSPDWLIDIFTKMGEEPSNENYVKPAKDDVWAFINKIGGWMLNPARKGIPN